MYAPPLIRFYETSSIGLVSKSPKLQIYFRTETIRRVYRTFRTGIIFTLQVFAVNAHVSDISVNGPRDDQILSVFTSHYGSRCIKRLPLSRCLETAGGSERTGHRRRVKNIKVDGTADRTREKNENSTNPQSIDCCTIALCLEVFEYFNCS